MNDPDSFQEVEAIDTTLEKHSKAELIALIKQMLEQDPDLESLLDLPFLAEESKPLSWPLRAGPGQVCDRGGYIMLEGGMNVALQGFQQSFPQWGQADFSQFLRLEVISGPRSILTLQAAKPFQRMDHHALYRGAQGVACKALINARPGQVSCLHQAIGK